MGTISVFRSYADALAKAVRAIPLDRLAVIAETLREARRRGNLIFIMGNGGSAATASHMACDLSKSTIRDGRPRLRVVALGDNMSLVTAWANDTGYENIFVQQLENLAAPGDVVIAISGSGRSENVLRAVRRARDLGITTIGLTGFAGGSLKDLVDIALVVDSTVMGQIEDVHHAIGHMLTEALSQPGEES
jgi:D-sedoheptulose 7-phosphate isomerase